MKGQKNSFVTTALNHKAMITVTIDYRMEDLIAERGGRGRVSTAAGSGGAVPPRHAGPRGPGPQGAHQGSHR